mmetsp:Transcript_52964/g.124071  ORF Transcript_52964/g.124071 Transcript_52964/m.124071 type:complete len:488 (+) Transcript_52964:41-1504(+)
MRRRQPWAGASSPSRWCTYLLVLGLTLSVLSPADGAVDRTKGVPPEEHSAYNADKFQCRDGSKTIASSRVNDDYCDCDDGSDEPGTSACPNGKFWCENKGHHSKFLYSSRVNDGFCDCCDGSDEFTGVTTCTDRCDEEGAERRRQLIEQIELHEQGLLKVPDYVDAAERYRTGVEARNKELVAQVAEKQAEIDLKKARQKELQEEVSAADAAKKAEEDKKKEEGERLKAEASVQDPEDKMSPEELKEAREKAWEDFKAAKEAGEVAEDGEEAEPEEEEAAEEEVAVAAAEDDIGAAEAEPQAPQQVEEAAAEEEEVPEDPKIAEARLELDEIKKEVRTMEAEVKKLRDELGVTETVLNGDFGKQGEFLALFQKCFTQNVQQYTYELCVFQKAAQKEGSSSQNLGTWGEWNKEGEPYSEMLYTKGGSCWNGPARTMRVSLVCGTDEFVISVQEPAKCTYTMEFMTPLACRRSKVTEAMAELEASGHPY